VRERLIYAANAHAKQTPNPLKNPKLIRNALSHETRTEILTGIPDHNSPNDHEETALTTVKRLIETIVEKLGHAYPQKNSSIA
jgi:hypothetical protein